MNLTRLSQLDFFRSIPSEKVAAILGACPVRLVRAGEVIFAPNEENHSLYLVLSGHCDVRLNNPDTRVDFPILAGEVFGEMSIIEQRPTSAWVTAREDGELVVIPEAIFWEQIVGDPVLMANLLKMLTNRMRRSNQVLMEAREKQLRYEQLQKELDMAGKIQANILPDARALLASFPSLDLAAWMSPAREVGGDFYDAFALDAQRLCIAIGDVSGKGMPAALFMVRVMTLLRMSVQASPDLSGVLGRVNQVLCENNPDFMFVTLFVGVLDVKSGLFHYSNGGHNLPLAALQNSGFSPLPSRPGMLLGVHEPAAYQVDEIQLSPGDSVLLYTDGVSEAEDPAQDFFGIERAIATLDQCAACPMGDLLGELIADINRFTSGAAQSDDITLLALRLLT